MEISVIIPAFNAAATIGTTLASLAAQTHPGFEAIVVDDGSSDRTAEIAQSRADRDHRFELHQVAHGGAAAARNFGLEAARGDLVLFLDADDFLDPAMLARTRAALGEDPAAVAAYCGWSRLSPDWAVVGHHFFRDSGDLFPVLAGIQPFAIHTCLARRTQLIEVGGFDRSLTTCEDWDLWQRVARTGGRFLCVPEVLAYYRTKAGSASQDPHRMLTDGLRVLAQGSSRDPRVPHPAPEWADGIPEPALRSHRYRLLSWSAGLALGQGQSPLPLCPIAADRPCATLEPRVVSDALVQSVLLPTGAGLAAWVSLWPTVADRLEALTAEIERRSQAPGLARGVLNQLEALIRDGLPRPVSIGRSLAVDLDPFSAVLPLVAPPDIDRARVHVGLGDPNPAAIDLPLFDGSIPADVLGDAIAAELGWPLLRAYLSSLPARPGAGTQETDWTTYLRELWGRSDWPLERFYQDLPEPAETRAIDSGATVIEVAEDLPDLVLVQPTAVVEIRVGGVALGEVEVEATAGKVAASRLRSAITRAAGLELLRAGVREGIIGQPLGGASLRARLAERAADRSGRRASAAPAVAIPRRARRDLDTPLSRRAALPRAALDDLLAAARTAGEPVPAAAAAGVPGQPIEYRPDLLEAGAPTEAEARPTAGAAAVAVPGRDTAEIAILVHHRIAADGDAADAPYRLAPSALEERLAMLRALGYRSVTLATWRRAMECHTPLPGRALVLTFDDATHDFTESAWPLLKRYGFAATLFVPTSAIDAGTYANPLTGLKLRALGWANLARLQAEGVEIGSHTCTHPFLTRLRPAEMVAELAGSRARLQDRLGSAVRALAYPFGDANPLVHHLAGACGYLYGLTCRPARSHLWDSLLALPRLDVSGPDTTIAALAAKLGLAAPDPGLRRPQS